MTLTYTVAGFILTVLSILALVAGGVRFLVKHYFAEIKAEFKPNGGSSVKDQINRLEAALEDQRIDSIKSRNRQENKIDEMYKILLEHIAKITK